MDINELVPLLPIISSPSILAAEIFRAPGQYNYTDCTHPYPIGKCLQLPPMNFFVLVDNGHFSAEFRPPCMPSFLNKKDPVALFGSQTELNEKKTSDHFF